MIKTKTYIAQPETFQANWWVVDATDKVVGRLASDIAMVLMGKHRPTYTPHVDTGDFVIVTNVDKVTFTGKKWDQKTYAWVTGLSGTKDGSRRQAFATPSGNGSSRGGSPYVAEEQVGV